MLSSNVLLYALEFPLYNTADIYLQNVQYNYIHVYNIVHYTLTINPIIIPALKRYVF